MKRAFSLIELIIALFIGSILVVLLSNLFSFNLKVLNDSSKDEGEYKDLYTAMLYVDNTIRRADRIYPSYFDKATYARKDTYLGEIKESTEKKYFNFHVENDRLYIRRRNDGTDKDGLTPNGIADIKSLDLFLEDELLIIKLVSKNETYELETMIDIGGKL